MCFTDAMGLLALSIQDKGTTDFHDFQYESKAKHLEHQSKDVAVFKASFKLASPKIFGDDSSKGNTISNRQLLLRCKMFKDFDSEVSHTSLRAQRMKTMRNQVTLLFHKAEDQLWNAARAVAKFCMMEAQQFIESLFRSFTATMYSMNAVSGPKSVDQNWRYVYHSVRAIFEHLHDRQTAGQYGEESEQAWKVSKPGSIRRNCPAKVLKSTRW